MCLHILVLWSRQGQEALYLPEYHLREQPPRQLASKGVAGKGVRKEQEHCPALWEEQAAMEASEHTE